MQSVQELLFGHVTPCGQQRGYLLWAILRASWAALSMHRLFSWRLLGCCSVAPRMKPAPSRVVLMNQMFHRHLTLRQMREHDCVVNWIYQALLKLPC